MTRIIGNKNTQIEKFGLKPQSKRPIIQFQHLF